MKVIITGSRKWDNPDMIFNALYKLEKRYGDDLLILEGGAKGADMWARVFCKQLKIKFQTFEADWEQFGRRAGMIRNRRMLEENPDLVIAFPLPRSIGTYGMMEIAEKAGVRVIDWPLEARKRATLRKAAPKRLRRVRKPPTA